MPKGVKYGGRKAGTPNKVTKTVREAIGSLLDAYMNGDPDYVDPENDAVREQAVRNGLFYNDFFKLKAKDRVFYAEKFSAYVAPKMQSVDVGLQDKEQQQSLVDKITKLAGEEKK